MCIVRKNESVHVVPPSVTVRSFHECDCEFVEPQIFSLTRKRKVCFVERRKYLNIDETPVEAPPATRRMAIAPTPQQSPPPPPGGTESPSDENTMAVEDHE